MEFDPEEYGYATWCYECNDCPDADIDKEYREYISGLIDYVGTCRDV